jgi:predicted nucleotidyltransferase
MSVLSLAEMAEIAIPIFNKYNIDEVYLFGSYARDEEDDDSDLDFYYIKKHKMSLTRFIEMKQELEEKHGKEADVISDLTLSLNMDKPDTKELLDAIMQDRKELAYAS